MSDRAKQHVDEAVTRAYRAASNAADERPSAAIRAAVLQFAQAHAPQKSLSKPSSKPRGAGWSTRWPYAAAATLLVGVLAGLLATQTEQHLPKETVALNQGAPQSAEPARSAETPAAPAPAAVDAPVAAKPQQSQAPAVSTAPSVTQRAARERSSATSEDKAVERKDELQRSQAAERSAAFPEAPVAAPAEARVEARQPQAKEGADASIAQAETARRLATPAPAAGLPSDAASADTQAAPARLKKALPETKSNQAIAGAGASSRGADDHVIARPVQRTRPMADGEGMRQEAEVKAELSADAWIARIVKLREQGRDAEADAELKKFRERHPNFEVPAAAQRAHMHDR